MELNAEDIGNSYAATLVASERLTPDDTVEVRHLVLQLPVRDFAFREGQAIAVLVQGPHEFGNDYHLRLYSIANSREGEDGMAGRIAICVRRCFYIDEVSGERYPGTASTFLCDARPGDTVLIAGPYGSHFPVPPNSDCNLLMVATGTGIAPFRAFVQRIYREVGGWQGKVRMFYGARTGMELLYANDVRRDLSLYYDEKTFQAFEAISPRPHVDDSPAIDDLMMTHAQEIWEMIQDPRTYVYVAGLAKAQQKFEAAMINMAGSQKAWAQKRWTLMKQQRYTELLQD